MTITKQGLILVFNCEDYSHLVSLTAFHRILFNVNCWMTLNKFEYLRFLLGFDSLLAFFWTFLKIFGPYCHVQLKVIRTLLFRYRFEEKVVVVAEKLTIVWFQVNFTFFIFSRGSKKPLGLFRLTFSWRALPLPPFSWVSISVVEGFHFKISILLVWGIGLMLTIFSVAVMFASSYVLPPLSSLSP